MKWSKRSLLTILASLVLLDFVFGAFATPYVYPTTGTNYHSSGTTLTCTLNSVSPYDTVFVLISSTKSISSVADSASNVYTAQSSAGSATGTLAAYAVIYTALPTARNNLVITVTLSSSSNYATVSCLDTVGAGSTAASSATATGVFNSGNNFAPSVSYSPTTGNFEVSVIAGSACGSPTVGYPSSPDGTLKPVSGLSAGTTCQTSPSTAFWFVGAAAYYLSAAGGATTDTYSVSGPQVVSTNSANWAEAAASFSPRTVLSQAVSETVGFSVQYSLRNVYNPFILNLVAHYQTGSPILSRPLGLTLHHSVAQAINTRPVLLCVFVYVSGSNTLYFCQVASVYSIVTTTTGTVVNPSPDQPLYWWFPLIVLGMFSGLFLGIGASYDCSPRALTYLFLAGLFIGSLACLMLGILNFGVSAILLLVLGVYSFRVRAG